MILIYIFVSIMIVDTNITYFFTFLNKLYQFDIYQLTLIIKTCNLEYVENDKKDINPFKTINNKE